MTRAILIALGLATIAAGCAKPQAKTPTPAPAPAAPLNVPSAPAVVLTPVQLDPVETPPVADPVVVTSKPAATLTAKPPAQNATPPPVTPPTPVLDVPPPVLQTTRSADEHRIKAQNDIIQTMQILAQVNRSRLSPDAQNTLGQAERFLRLARDKMDKKDFAGAASDADKALIYAQALVKGSGLTATVS